MQSNAARAGLGALLVVVAVVLFVVLQDDGSDEETPAGRGTQVATTDGDPGSDGAKPPPPVPEIVVRDGAPVGGVAEIDVTSGDVVRFEVRSDEAGEVHVHGYEIEKPVEAGKPASVVFPAGLEGGYEVELHSHTTGDIPIAELAVSPG